MLFANEEYSFKRLTATGLVKTGSGECGGIFVASGTPTIKIYDGTDNSGTVIVNTFQAAAATAYPVPARIVKGIYIELNGTCDITVYYN